MVAFRAFVLVVLIAVIASCGSTEERVVYLSDLPIPVRPVLPTIEPEELKCLPNETYLKLRERDLMRRQYEVELEDIIKGSPSAVTE